MKLLHVIGTIDPETGGTFEGLVRTAEAMDAMGIDVAIASMDPPGLFDSIARQWNFPCYQIGADERTYYAYSGRAEQWLQSHVQDYDAVIVHGLWQFHGYAVSKASRSSGVPYYVFSHGMLDPWFNRRYPLKRIKKQAYWWFREFAVVKHARAMLFTTEEEMRLAAQSFRPYTCRPAVVGYGTSGPPRSHEALTAEFRNEAAEWGQKPYLLYMGRIQEKKGVDLLLHAYGEIRRGRPDIPELVIAGTAHDPTYLTMLREKFPQDGVHWVGHVSGPLKWQTLATAEAMVLVSHQENFGIVVAEALSVATPVLISNKVNIWREIKAANAGIIVDDDLAGAKRLLLEWLNLRSETKREMSAAAADTFRRNFDIRSSTRKLLQQISQDENAKP